LWQRHDARIDVALQLSKCTALAGTHRERHAKITLRPHTARSAHFAIRAALLRPRHLVGLSSTVVPYNITPPHTHTRTRRHPKHARARMTPTLGTKANEGAIDATDWGLPYGLAACFGDRDRHPGICQRERASHTWLTAPFGPFQGPRWSPKKKKAGSEPDFRLAPSRRPIMRRGTRGRLSGPPGAALGPVAACFVGRGRGSMPALTVRGHWHVTRPTHRQPQHQPTSKATAA
jgi:hypothetical protein